MIKKYTMNCYALLLLVPQVCLGAGEQTAGETTTADDPGYWIIHVSPRYYTSLTVTKQGKSSIRAECNPKMTVSLWRAGSNPPDWINEIKVIRTNKDTNQSRLIGTLEVKNSTSKDNRLSFDKITHCGGLSDSNPPENERAYEYSIVLENKTDTKKKILGPVQVPNCPSFTFDADIIENRVSLAWQIKTSQPHDPMYSGLTYGGDNSKFLHTPTSNLNDSKTLILTPGWGKIRLDFVTAGTFSRGAWDRKNGMRFLLESSSLSDSRLTNCPAIAPAVIKQGV